MDERLHRLIGGAIRLGNGLFVRERLQRLDVFRGYAARAQKFCLRLAVSVVLLERGRKPLRAQRIDNGAAVLFRVFDSQLQFHGADEVIAVALAESLFYALRHGVVKVDDGLAAVLVVLVGLYGDAGQRRIGIDVVRLAQIAVAGGKAVLKQLDEIDLAAGGGQREKIHVVDMDIPVAVRLGVFGLEHEHEVELLGALRAVLEHRSHGRIAVDIGVFALDVGIDGGFVGDVLVDAHQAGVHLADAAALGAIEYITLGRAHKAVFDQHTLDGILHFFHGRFADGFVLFQFVKHLARQLFSRFDGLGAVAGTERLHDGVGDLLRIKRNPAPIALDDDIDHCGSLRKIVGPRKRADPLYCG